MARPRQYDDALRRRLLDLASELISTDGADALSVRSLAARAGTTTAAIYTLFGGRAQVVDAVVAEGLARFAAHLQAVDRTGEAGTDLTALGMAYRASALADPHFYRVMFSASGLRAGAASLTEPTFAILRSAVARVMPTAPEEQVEDQAVRAWGLVHGLVSLELGGLLPGPEAEQAARYQRMLRTPPPPG